MVRAFFVGLFLDLLSSSYFGLFAVGYPITTFLLFGLKKTFFEDKLFTLSLMTAIFSFLSTLVTLFILLFFGEKSFLSFRWCAKDLLGSALLNGLWAYLFFSLPFQLTSKISKMNIFRKIREES